MTPTGNGKYSGPNIERLADDLPPLPAPEPGKSMTAAERSKFYNSPLSPDIPPEHRQVMYPDDF